MQYIHPVFMLALLIAVFHLHRLGKQALAINPKSPEADQHSQLLQQHARLSKIISGLFFVGIVGGIFSLVQFLQVREVFQRTYGHGFAGAIVLGLLLGNIFVGSSIKNPKKAKAQANLRRFHFYLFYFTLLVVIYVVISGAMVLYKGPAAL